ncbi:MAG: hypothetical protein ACRDQ7_15715 [Haloechinothrix sp.]
MTTEHVEYRVMVNGRPCPVEFDREYADAADHARSHERTQSNAYAVEIQSRTVTITEWIREER